MHYELEIAKNGVVLKEIWQTGEFDCTEITPHINTEVFELPIFRSGQDDFDETEIEQVQSFLYSILEIIGLENRKYSKTNFRITVEEGDHHEFSKRDIEFLNKKIEQLEEDTKYYKEIIAKIENNSL